MGPRRPGEAVAQVVDLRLRISTRKGRIAASALLLAPILRGYARPAASRLRRASASIVTAASSTAPVTM